jgi:VWFA-related protein
MEMARSRSAAIVCGVLTVGSICGQQSAPLFRAGSKLVEVEVTVLDRKGNPVTGLTQEAFTVRDENKLQSIAFFHYDGATEPAPAPQPPAPSSSERHTGPLVFTNRVDSGSESPNVTALVLDALNTPPEQNMAVRAQVMRYLNALAPQVRMAIFYMGPQQMWILHDFTDDAAALRAQLAKAVLGMPPGTVTDLQQSMQEAQAFVDMFKGMPQERMIRASMERQLAAESAGNSAARRNRMEQSLGALEALGHHLAAMPGRKNLVWIGAGFSMASIDATGPANTLGGNFEDKIRETARRLAQDGVVLYIVESGGLPSGPFNGISEPAPSAGSFDKVRQAEEANNDPHAAMSLMASVTGGRYSFNTNDLTSGFQQAAADLRGSYRLGFYAPEAPDGQWRKLRVQVKQSGVTVHHREGYRTDTAAAQPVAWTEENWRSALTNPLGSSVIPLKASYRSAPAGERVLELTVGIEGIHFRREGDNLKADLQVAVGELMADGRALPAYTTSLNVSVPAAKWEETRTSGIPFRRQWTPSAEAAGMRVVVLDVVTGQYGSVEVRAR